MRIRFNATPTTTIIQEQLLMKKIEFAQMKRQIEVLSTFLPDEILKLKANELQEIHTYVGVLLFGDVSGFTPLTAKYNKTGKGGIYRLTGTLNAYIGAIVEVMYFYGGDVLKFSGDAFLTLWKVQPDDSLFEILHNVVVCALVIQKNLGVFETEVNVALKVKLAISCGNMIFSVIGDDKTKHYVITGEAINEVKAAEHASVSGDVMISPAAWAHMLQERYETSSAEGGNTKVWGVLYKPSELSRQLYFDERQLDVQKLIEKHLSHRNFMASKRKFDSSVKESKIVEEFIRSLPARYQMKQAPRNWIVEGLRPFIIKPVLDQVDESQPVEYLTEMREITIQFINIVPKTYSLSVLVPLVDKAYKIICKIASDVLGVVNKVSLFDKDIMVLVLFGLRGINHELESQNALRSAYRIRMEILRLPHVVSASIGITNGLVYCGVVGHPTRREYTVIGASVNKAARFMISYPNKVTCDHRTFKHSKLASFYFILQIPLKLKGIEDAGNIFEYNEQSETTQVTSEVSLPLIGRDSEYNLIKAIVYDPESVGYYGVCFHGPMKIGRSKLLEYSYAKLDETKSFSIAWVELESLSNIPYFCVSKLYRQLYDLKTRIRSDHTGSSVHLPMNLCDYFEEMQNASEDIALRKYRFLNYFRDMATFDNRAATVLIIDNIEFVDVLSWEILEIVMNEDHMRLISTANFEQTNWELKFNITISDRIRLVELLPLRPEHIPAVACQFVAACGIPRILCDLLILSCDGRPGYVQTCLLRMVNNESIELKLINESTKDDANYTFVPYDHLLHNNDVIIPIIDLSDKYKREKKQLTQHAISLDLFDSFTPYQQLVVKTGSVLGKVFTRTLLIVALKYPPEPNLAKVIAHLFQEEVLDCGSRFIYARDSDFSKICCRCYFEEGYFEYRNSFPQYAYCKVLHFKNRNIRDVAYGLLPANQRKELHLLCTDVLESMCNQCPSCLRNPINNFLNFPKFKDIMTYCNNPNLPFNTTKCEYGAYGDIKDCIRKTLRGVYEFKKDSTAQQHYSGRITDPKLCNCFEILARVYKELIYHSEHALHFGKRIFFTMHYGLLLILMQDFVGAISSLTEARELCLIDCKMAHAQITETFRRIHVGKIELGLAKACLDLRQLKAAKNHLIIALRQYNIPSLALCYKPFSQLLTRSFIVNRRTTKPFVYKNTIVRADMGTCMAYCAKLFTIEGNWKFAKLCSAYGIYLLRSVNNNVSILFEAYCDAIDIYRFCNDMHMCEKLQKYVVKELQLNYASNQTYNLYSLNTLLHSLFEIRFISGDIVGGIRLGYRVFDITTQMFTYFMNVKLVSWLALLLMYNFRIKDCADLCKFLYKTSGNLYIKKQMTYYIMSMIIYMQSGFILEDIDKIIDFAERNFKRKLKLSWEELLLAELIRVHMLRLGKYQDAESWKYPQSFNAFNLKREIVFKTALFALESKLLVYIKNRRSESAGVSVEERNIKYLLEDIKDMTEKHYKVFIPAYLCYAAWYKRIRNHPKAAERLLKQAEKVCDEQQNMMYKCFLAQLRNSWSGGFGFAYSERPMVDYHSAVKYNYLEWAQFLTPFPLD